MSQRSLSVAEKRAAFRELHESGCFLLPNPWDVGSARFLEGLGFRALATTSSGIAWSLGLADHGPSREIVLERLREMVAATNVPINADLEGGFGEDAVAVAESVRLAVGTGVAGLSIEDATRDAADPLLPMDVAVERVRAARRAIDETGGDTLLVGRAEGFIVGRPNLEDTLARLVAYAKAGADCLYAPGVRTPEHVRAIVAAVAPKPVNVLVAWPTELTLNDFAGLGVRRVSVGGALARTAWGGFMRAARTMADGRFDLAGAASGGELNALFER